VYYDHLVLGDGLAVPYYPSPSNITVTTAFGPPGNPVIGAYIAWHSLTPPQVTPSVPWTAYHIYKSLSPGGVMGAGPYVSIGFVKSSNPVSVTQFVDTANMGGGVTCYKILSCNNGPMDDTSLEKLNTINASYNEPLLSDATHVVEVCGYVAARPTLTFTQTVSPTYATPTLTWTPGWATPTNTPIIQPTGTISLTNAYVYPNPFNPNSITAGYGGTGRFHVSNVQLNTKIHIYAMDGSLVKDGVYSEGSGFTWDGRNKNGSKVVSGLYYLVLEDPQHKTIVFRIIVCYKCNPVYTPQ
jgi:hypothetical protein